MQSGIRYEKKFESEEDGRNVEYLLEYSVNERNEVKHVRITKILYPLKCCLNNIQTVIEIGEGEKEFYKINIYRVRNGWNGSGRDNLFLIEFSDYADESPAFLTLDTLEMINSIDLLREYIKDIIEYVRDVYLLSVESIIE